MMTKVVKLIFSLLIALLPLLAVAQPVIDQNWYPAHGTQNTMVHLDTNSFLYPPAIGANQTWDYSGIVVTSTHTGTFVDPNNTPYAADYPMATHATDDGTGEYDYAQVDATGWYDLGLVNSTMMVVYTDPYRLMPFPFTYNDVATDSFISHYIYPTDTMDRFGSATIEGVGYGTLILPSGTVTDALCLKVDATAEDYNDGMLLFETVSEEYLFISPTQEYVLLRLMVTNAGFGSQKFGMATAGLVGVDELSTGTFAEVYPNPVINGSATLRIDMVESSIGEVVITDLMGREVRRVGRVNLLTDVNDIELNTTGLNSGVYFVSVRWNDQVINKKLVIDQ